MEIQEFKDKVLAISNDDIKNIIKNIEDEILRGYKEPLEAIVMQKVLTSLSDRIKNSDIIQNAAQEEYHLYDSKEDCVFKECKITMSSTSRYDFSKTEIHKKLSAQIKEIQDLAKATKTKTFWIDEDGESHDVYPAIKKNGKSFFKVNIK